MALSSPSSKDKQESEMNSASGKKKPLLERVKWGAKHENP